ncbi:uracil-DNA glycosylase [Virgibacillus halodenitrificans]|uniref:uracil-DNA glycosylase n=1 Tax=Virgibacillus halodenitrificans TaxID=1482 RepID=UPI0013CE4EA4|nr:uracil-DNA glycosylase [Virgibacillus halodenitrificans]
MKSILLQHLSTHPTWESFFNRTDIINILKDIESKIGHHFTPAPEKVLRFAEMNLDEVKIIIIGKDPYPQEGVATGKAFEVNGVSSWFDKGLNNSLKNILKAIHKHYFKLDKGVSISKVREDIEYGKFPILPPNEAFDEWEKQGVLFLNTAFTCEIGGIEQAGSHLSIWKLFFEELLVYIVNQNTDIKYFLWGDARKYEKPLRKENVLEEHLYLSLHPCTNGDKEGYERNSYFLNNPCFRDTGKDIEWVKENKNKFERY